MRVGWNLLVPASAGWHQLALPRALSRVFLAPAAFGCAAGAMASAIMRPAMRWGYVTYGLLCGLPGFLAFVMSVVWIGYWLYVLLKGFLL